jgi:DNA-binding transcriptional MocR family regulator
MPERLHLENETSGMRLAPFKLERYFAKHEFSAPYLLCSSDCESVELGDLLALEHGAREQLDSLWLGYTQPLGDPQLRQAIAMLYDHIAADQVLVHAGAEEAIFNFMNVALSPRGSRRCPCSLLSVTW